MTKVISYAIVNLLILITVTIGGNMGAEQTVSKSGVNIKRKRHPVGRLGANIKQGMHATYTAFFREYDRTGLPRVGEASIRP